MVNKHNKINKVWISPESASFLSGFLEDMYRKRPDLKVLKLIQNELDRALEEGGDI